MFRVSFWIPDRRREKLHEATEKMRAEYFFRVHRLWSKESRDPFTNPDLLVLACLCRDDFNICPNFMPDYHGSVFLTAVGTILATSRQV